MTESKPADSSLGTEDEDSIADQLLAPHTFDYYLKLFGTKRNMLGVDWETTGDPGEEILHFLLAFDGHEPHPQGCINIFQLLRAVNSSGLYYIHSCTCGQPPCAGFQGGTIVVHDSGLVLWKTDEERIKSLYLFEAAQFREAILRASKEALVFLDRTPKGQLALESATLERFAIAIEAAEKAKCAEPIKDA